MQVERERADSRLIKAVELMANVPDTQCAVQLVGPDELVLNTHKQVVRPGRRQVLARVEAVGLCFSDLKLLKQFAGHVRKGGVVSGIDPEILSQVPSYVPGDAPTVPGHEAVVRIVEVGPGVEHLEPGRRFLVQTDYRWLRTADSNAAFGYNFEGALQQYVLMDERIITSPEGESLLIPVSEGLAASAVALVEPMACVEDAYASNERRHLRQAGELLVVADAQPPDHALENLFRRYGRPAGLTWVSQFPPPRFDFKVKTSEDLSQLADAGCDDVIYFGSDAARVEPLFAKVAAGGLLNIVLCGGNFGRDVLTTVGRVHYGGIRIIGTPGPQPAESMDRIPETGRIRPGDRIHIIGAGGPMGMMHVIRDICQGVQGVSVFASDVDDARLDALERIAAPLAARNRVPYTAYNPGKEKIARSFDYTVLMVPAPDLVARSVRDAAAGGIINIFAGIPADVTGRIDLDAYIKKRLYFIGTSGSVLEDMKRVLAKVESGMLDTNVCVAAVCGLDGAPDGIRAVENRRIAGKIIVYPACRGLQLVTLQQLQTEIPKVGNCLRAGLWTRQAEEVLLEMYRDS
ncbi:MAG: alcohol dehydrogenase catalytic domain-containing protein [Planctomycetota bacterium]